MSAKFIYFYAFGRKLENSTDQNYVYSKTILLVYILHAFA